MTRTDLDAHAAAFFVQERLAGPGVVAVSGGRDSMVLFDVLARLRRAALVLHVHHGLRGADADADAALVGATGARLGVPVRIVRAGPAPETGVEAWARRVRLDAFADAAREVSAGWVATAHHEDDQAETLLLALLRGAGTRGMAGMRPARRLSADTPEVQLIRPFLEVPRAVLAAYADTHGLAWRHDASNDDRRLRRNALRHDVLPRLEALMPGAAHRLARSAAAVAAERRLAAPVRGRLLRAALTPDLRGGTVSLDALSCLGPEIRRGLLLGALEAFLPGVPADARMAARLEALATAQVGRRLIHPVGTVWRGRDVLVFVRTVEAAAGSEAGPDPDALLLAPGASVAVPGGVLRLDVVAAPPEAFARDPDVAWFDADTLALPLTVRRWRAGDRVRPFGGMARPGSRLVSDVLTSERVAPEQRAEVCVALDATDEVVAVVGVRAGSTARVTPVTRSVLALRLDRR